MLVRKRTLVACLYFMYESRHRFSNILESRDARLPNRFDENRHQSALKPPKTVLLQIAQKPRIIRETRPKWTFSRSRISLCKSLGNLPCQRAIKNQT